MFLKEEHSNELSMESNPLESDSDKLKLCVVSRLSNGKGFDRLLKLVESLEEKNINYINLLGYTNELNLEKPISTLNDINGLKIVNAYTTSFENIPKLTYYSRGKLNTNIVKSN